MTSTPAILDRRWTNLEGYGKVELTYVTMVAYPYLTSRQVANVPVVKRRIRIAADGCNGAVS